MLMNDIKFNPIFHSLRPDRSRCSQPLSVVDETKDRKRCLTSEAGGGENEERGSLRFEIFPGRRDIRRVRRKLVECYDSNWGAQENEKCS